MFNKIVSILLLTIIVILAYFVVMQITSFQLKRKRTRLSEVVNSEEEQQQDNKLLSFLERKGWLPYVSPLVFIEEAKKYNVEVSKLSFISTFLVGTIIGAIVILVYFHAVSYMLPLCVLGGVVAVSSRLHNIKKNYLEELDSKISIYMSAMSTAMGTFRNTRDSILAILPSLEDPIKNDVELALLQLQDGKSIKEAFQHFQKYKINQLRLFHDQLDAISKGGTEKIDTLREVAFKMKKKETYRRQILTAHRRERKNWKTMAILALTLPFLFLIGSFDNYWIVMNNIASSIVFLFTFAMIWVAYRQLEKLEIYDPTKDDSAQL